MFFNNQKILIYPFSYKNFPMVKILLNNKFDIIVATQEGTGLVGKDIGFSVNRKECNVQILKYSDEIMDKADVLFIPEGNIDDPINMDIRDIIQKAINNDKIIVSLLELEEKDLYLLEYLNFINLQSRNNLELNSYFARVKENRLSYFIPRIPVIYVGGVFDIIDNSYIAISMKQKFEKSGYKTSCITRENYGKVFDCLTFPHSFIDNQLSIEDRIIEFNNYIRAVVELEKPQVLIIQIPFGMIRYSEYHENSFGSYAFMISEAVKSDYFICTSTSDMLVNKYFQELSNYFDKKFNSPIDALHISNCQFDIPVGSRANKLDIIFKNESEINYSINNLKKELDFKVYNLFIKEHLQDLFEDIMNILG